MQACTEEGVSAVADHWRLLLSHWASLSVRAFEGGLVQGIYSHSSPSATRETVLKQVRREKKTLGETREGKYCLGTMLLYEYMFSFNDIQIIPSLVHKLLHMLHP